MVLNCCCSVSCYCDYVNNCCYNCPTICYQGCQIWHGNDDIAATSAFGTAVVKYQGNQVNVLRLSNAVDLLHYGYKETCNVAAASYDNAAAINIDLTSPLTKACYICDNCISLNDVSCPLTTLYNCYYLCGACFTMNCAHSYLDKQLSARNVTIFQVSNCNFYRLAATEAFEGRRQTTFNGEIYGNVYTPNWTNTDCIVKSSSLHLNSFIGVNYSTSFEELVNHINLTVPHVGITQDGFLIPNPNCYSGQYAYCFMNISFVVRESLYSVAVSDINDFMGNIYANMGTNCCAAVCFCSFAKLYSNFMVPDIDKQFNTMSPLFFRIADLCPICARYEGNTNYKAPANLCQDFCYDGQTIFQTYDCCSSRYDPSCICTYIAFSYLALPISNYILPYFNIASFCLPPTGNFAVPYSDLRRLECMQFQGTSSSNENAIEIFDCSTYFRHCLDVQNYTGRYNLMVMDTNGHYSPSQMPPRVAVNYDSVYYYDDYNNIPSTALNMFSLESAFGCTHTIIRGQRYKYEFQKFQFVGISCASCCCTYNVFKYCY